MCGRVRDDLDLDLDLELESEESEHQPARPVVQTQPISHQQKAILTLLQSITLRVTPGTRDGNK